jgi:ABC-type polysaccharide/polyol phosphate transport system ATPase subunit
VKMTHVILNDVCLEYPVYNGSSRSVRQLLFRQVGGEIAYHNQAVTVRALDRISFSLHEGDRLGIVGHNGAGKTTLLRIIAGAYWPTHGSIDVDGTRSALTDISMGLDPELTGYNNVINKLVLMGMTFKEAQNHSKAVEEFSELGSYLALPMRTYSTGMYLRLAFAIATSIAPDILILDEMIGAGDARFIEKAKKRTDEFLDQTKIMVISSHDMDLIRRYCNKILWLENGAIKKLASDVSVISEYLNATAQI